MPQPSNFSLESMPSALKKQDGPLWKGPEVDGVTQSMLAKFLVDRERFRVYYIEGLQQTDSFNHRVEYGNMWHVCEEALASQQDVMGALMAYGQQCLTKYPGQTEEIMKWLEICTLQFPEYVTYWERHADVHNRSPLFSEQVFDVLYKLPSGRKVRLRGKWDSVDIVDKKVWLQENKTKGSINEGQIKRQLKFDLQSMFYLVSLVNFTDKDDLPNIGQISGVRYNVIRRPLSGGKGTIRQKEKESKAEFYGRLLAYIREDPSSYFTRWNVPVAVSDISKFTEVCLNPILEQLCIWYDWITSLDPAPEEYGYGVHYRMPYGVYSPLIDRTAGETELDDYLDNGSTVGLVRVNKLFHELS